VEASSDILPNDGTDSCSQPLTLIRGEAALLAGPLRRGFASALRAFVSPEITQEARARILARRPSSRCLVDAGGSVPLGEFFNTTAWPDTRHFRSSVIARSGALHRCAGIGSVRAIVVRHAEIRVERDALS
jgi:hypothetical protein